MVTVIIPNYNHSIFLPRRIDSILRQTYKNFELIILDDASNDNSLSILKTFKRHPKVSHFITNNKNSGSPFLQWEKGIRLSKGKYIWIAESDDYCDLNFLESQLSAIETNNINISVAKTLKYTDSGIGDEIQHPLFKDSRLNRLSVENFNYCPILNVSAVLFKKELSEKACFYKNFKIIGDRVFYHETFNGQSIFLNKGTKSYCFVSGPNVSNINNRSSNYYRNYFNEHLRFANWVYKDDQITKDAFNNYINRFYARIRDRMSKKEKLSMNYLLSFISYKINLK